MPAIPGLGVFPDPPPARGPLAIRGQVHVLSGTNVAVVTGLTPAAFDPTALSLLTGQEGPAGLDGRDGDAGTVGPTGPTGPVGPPGAQGAAGAQGFDGQDGRDGDAGAVGATGAQGPAGATGPKGLDGLDGADGQDGQPGIDGQQGQTGPIGPTGPQGPAGLNGQNGLDGADGLNGLDGDAGTPGATGPIGPTGATGPQGLNGFPGLDGTDGLNGLDGDAGTPGATGPIGPTGATGPQGPAGLNGQNGLDGTDGLNGLDGDAGTPGATGPAGATGPTGPQGLNGFPGLDGTDGLQGDPGLDGMPGPTGPAGSNGATGATGATGPVGMQGMDGADGDDQVFGNIPLYPWWQSLQLDAHSRGFSPIIDANQFLQLGATDGAPPGTFHQIRSGDALLGIHGQFLVRITADTDFQVVTNAVPRLTIKSTGEWQLNGLGGTATQVLTSNGPGVAPTWQAASGGGSGPAALGVVSVNFGSVAQNSGFFDITGLTGLHVNDPVAVSMAVDTADPTESEQGCVITGIVTSTTTIRCYWNAIDLMQGTRKVQYLIATGAAFVATSGNAITVTSTVDLTGSTSVINNTPTAGPLGVFDISTLQCGGVLNFQALSESSIDGFTAKNDGFWFTLHVRDATTGEYLTIGENTGNTTTSVRTPAARDWRMTKNDAVTLIYSSTRWRVQESVPKLWMVSADSPTWAAQQDNYARTGRGISVIRATLTGNQTLTSIVPDSSPFPGGEFLLIENIDTTDTLTIRHDDGATGTAANRFFLPESIDLKLPPRASALFKYDGTTARWRCISMPVALPFRNQASNLPGDTVVWDTASGDWIVQQAAVPVPDTSQDWEIWEEQRFGYLVVASQGLTTAAQDAFIGATNGQLSQWICFASAARGSYGQGAPEFGHNGLLQLTTGTTSADYACLTMCLDRTNASSGIIQCTDIRALEWWVLTAAITLVEIIAGHGTDSSLNLANFGVSGAFFIFNPAVSANWQCVTRSASTNTTTTTSVAVVASAWYRLTIWVHPTNPAGHIRFYINNALVATHTTNIPAAAVVIAARVQTKTTVQKVMQVDTVRIKTNTNTMIA